MVIDSKIFNFDFFLSDRKTVSFLAYGAEMFGNDLQQRRKQRIYRN